MNASVNRRRVRLLMVAFAAAAFAAPAAQARHAPGEDPVTTSPRHFLAGGPAKDSARIQWNASPLEIDRLGPKHVALQHPIAPPSASVVNLVKPAGFRWDDAAVGGGVAAFAVALVALLTVFLTRRGRRAALLNRSKPAGA